MRSRTNQACSALEYIPVAIREAAIAKAKILKQEAGEPVEDNQNASDTSWILNQVTESILANKSEKTRWQTLKQKTLFFLFITLSALTAKSKKTTTHTGLVGWLEQRPFSAVMLNGLAGVLSLICHAFVSYAAWKNSGIWGGLATVILMGFSELYWCLKFFFTVPANIWLGLASLLVILHVFVFNRAYKKAAIAIAGKYNEIDDDE